MTEEKMSFEIAYEELQKAVEILNDENTSLDEALNQYKEGIKYYNYCIKKLDEAKQVIEVYDSESGELREGL